MARLKSRYRLECEERSRRERVASPIADADAALDRLRELIRADPRPDKEIAEAAGMGPAQFSQLKTGRRLRAEIHTIAPILRALGLPFGALDG